MRMPRALWLGIWLVLLLACPQAMASEHDLNQQVSHILGDVVSDRSALRPGAALEFNRPLGLSPFRLLVRPEIYAGDTGEVGTGVSLGLDIPLSAFNSRRTIAVGVRISAAPLTASERAGTVAFDRPTLRFGENQDRLVELMVGDDVMRHPDLWAQTFSMSLSFTTWF